MQQGVVTSPVLSVRDLRASFRGDGGWNEVVHGLSFDVDAGETLAIVGESGSGKSVTALSIMRLLDNSKVTGSVKLEGQELLSLSERDMRRVRGQKAGMIFQEPMTSLNPVMTVGEQIAEALRSHTRMSSSAARQETLRLLERVRIPAAKSRIDEYPHNFSGGMRQRVMIAIALACKPKLLIADEPTTALDVTIQAQILGLLAELQREEGTSVLFITHDMGVVAEIADRTLVMLNGNLVEQGSTKELFKTRAHPYTRALLASVPVLGSMAGEGLPKRFPIVDKTTGLSLPVSESNDTVRNDRNPLLEVTGLTTRFDIRKGAIGRVMGRVHAVENVSFDLRVGETLSLVGESGCGKSTTGRSILQLTMPTQGTVSVDGSNVIGARGQELRNLRKNVQVVFQDPFASLNPRVRVGVSIVEPIEALGLATKSEMRDRAADLMSRVGLAPEMLTKFPHEFSGGQRQRICIARALATEPKLIIADEAVSALDVSVKAQVVNLMMDLQERMGISYLFISHDMAVVERVSHRVAVMYLGEIVEIGPREAIFGNPQHPYTKRLIEAVPVPDPARRRPNRQLSNDDLKSPIRSPTFAPPARMYREVNPGHKMQVWAEDWEK